MKPQLLQGFRGLLTSSFSLCPALGLCLWSHTVTMALARNKRSGFVQTRSLTRLCRALTALMWSDNARISEGTDVIGAQRSFVATCLRCSWWKTGKMDWSMSRRAKRRAAYNLAGLKDREDIFPTAEFTQHLFNTWRRGRMCCMCLRMRWFWSSFSKHPFFQMTKTTKTQLVLS